MTDKKRLLTWMFILVFFAGLINALSVYLFATTTSHVTGLVTNSAIALFSGNTSKIIWLQSVLASFFVGCVVAGYITGERAFHLQKRYGWIIITIGVLMMIGIHVFSREGKNIIRLFGFLMGLQNGLVVSYRGIVVRMTHMSGNLTDLGVHIGYALHGKFKENFIPILIPGVGLILFFLGGLLGLWLFSVISFWVYDLVGFIYYVLGTYYISYWAKFSD